MNMSLFDQVLNESYSADLGGYSYDSLDAAEESYINDVITDDPVTLFQYTGECSNAIMALEAAEARMEGMMCVKFMNARAANDEVAMEETVATMEGFIGNMWETLKEIVKKAYAAVKAFLIKVWNKMKGYGNVVKAFFTKYGDVLRHKRVPGLRVKWERIEITAAEPVMMRYLEQVSQAVELLRTRLRNEANTYRINSRIAERIPNNPRSAQGFDDNPHGAYNLHLATNNALPSPHDINAALDEAIYPQRNRSENDLEAEFERIRPEAIEAADISSYKKYIDNFMAIGNKRYQADLKLIEDLKRELAKHKAEDTGNKVGSIHTEIRRCLNAEIEIINLSTHAMSTAAKRMQSQSISACRKAIMYHATEGNGATYADESYVPADSAADAYFDGFMSDLGY